LHDAFRITYRQQVGSLHEQLEKLELELAEAELGEMSRRIGNTFVCHRRLRAPQEA
jgi:hypothetical protein